MILNRYFADGGRGSVSSGNFQMLRHSCAPHFHLNEKTACEGSQTVGFICFESGGAEGDRTLYLRPANGAPEIRKMLIILALQDLRFPKMQQNATKYNRIHVRCCADVACPTISFGIVQTQD